MASTQTVLAGVDGSQQSLHAARWAAAEAYQRCAPLRLVFINNDPARTEYAQQSVREAAASCRESTPEVDVSEEIATGDPIEQLIGASRQAKLVVVGSRGHGSFALALLGSVSAALAAHAHSPVVVVHGEGTCTGPVVVGVDDSPHSRAALGFGYAAARRCGVELIAVQAWHAEGLLSVPLPPEDQDLVRQRAEWSLGQQMEDWQARFPDVRAHAVVCRSHPVAALVDAARDAQLLVVGHRGRGGFTGLYLGSVASGVLRHAQCPVAVIPAPKDGRGGTA